MESHLLNWQKFKRVTICCVSNDVEKKILHNVGRVTETWHNSYGGEFGTSNKIP